MVVKSIVSTRLYTDPNGFCELDMDNCYSALELFVMLKTKYKILAHGTVGTNRRGWDTNVTNLLRTIARGKSKTFYNPINGILFRQWKDNEVVSFISSLSFVGNVTTMWQCGSKKVPFNCPKALQAYNKYMGYVDLIDFDKRKGRLFTEKRRFKKL